MPRRRLPRRPAQRTRRDSDARPATTRSASTSRPAGPHCAPTALSPSPCSSRRPPPRTIAGRADRLHSPAAQAPARRPRPPDLGHRRALVSYRRVQQPLSPIQTAVVTGASRGLGRAIAAALVAAGTHVVSIARDADTLREGQGELGEGFTPVVADTTDEALAEAVLAVVCLAVAALTTGTAFAANPAPVIPWRRPTRPPRSSRTRRTSYPLRGSWPGSDWSGWRSSTSA
ncbi:SDR family NAD(P)-dependent oxidoreductase [Amycolatopsis sp. NPDC058278]|uniref:SDR family NAD(P)-dependent oxidoreductase n=1 Tax=Amycolatopsis sp. NPDC058278 TaxID=3346417 RepID=UPI0036D930C8